EAAVNNARRFLEIQGEFGSFGAYVWRFTGGRPLRRQEPITVADIPATSPESDALAKDLKQRGFKFLGSTVCYAHMQATGMVDDHVSECFRAPRE
ncbi:MAG: DNA-3-methyladenine glycosylase I, partial [Dehalococcoidia bacterium]